MSDICPPYSPAVIRRIQDSPIPLGAKGWPAAAAGQSAREVGNAKWNLLRGDLPFPVLVLQEDAIANNLAVMQRYCERHRVHLAPHAKTTMAPELIARQLDAGAWGVTVATPVQLQIMKWLGVRRIIYANQLVEPQVIQWLADQILSDRSFECYCLVDSAAGVEVLDRELDRLSPRRPLSVLVEIGLPHTRCGCRTANEAYEVCKTVANSRHIRLAGIEGFEGLIDDRPEIGAFLEQIDETYARAEADHLFNAEGEPFVTAGGSSYFDLVVNRLSHRRLILRSGCYVTHDDGIYNDTSPLSRTDWGEERLINALELWSVVLSRPEPRLAVTSMGKRDVGFDRGFPTPRRVYSASGSGMRPLDAAVVSLSDQHAHVQLDADQPLEVGELICCTISHPCTTLDKWRVIPIVTREYSVTALVHTYF